MTPKNLTTPGELEYNAIANMNSTITYFGLERQYQTIGKEIMGKINAVAKKSTFSSGPFVASFEKKFAHYLGVKNVVALNSGTSALHLALLAANVKAGDEVILPSLTFIATAEAVSYLGATPVFVDVTSDTWQIDSTEVEKKITKKTKAIIGVHLFGQPFDVDPVLKIAKKYHLVLIEDCAQAHGAKYKGKMIGSFGEFACFSFYPSKNLGAWGEAGAVVTKSKTASDRLKMLRDHGQKRKYYHDEIGFNYRMDGIQGAVLDVKLKFLNQWNRRRREIAKNYLLKIVNKKIRFQKQPNWAKSAFHLFVVLVDDRRKFIKFLEKHQIFPAVHYPIPLHRQNAYRHLGYKKDDFPNSEYYSDHAVSLPMYPELTDSEVSKVTSVINSY